MQPVFPGVFKFQNKWWTQNLVPGQKVYGEKLESFQGKEFRHWNPFKSKCAADPENGFR